MSGLTFHSCLCLGNSIGSSHWKASAVQSINKRTPSSLSCQFELAQCLHCLCPKKTPLGWHRNQKRRGSSPNLVATLTPRPFLSKPRNFQNKFFISSTCTLCPSLIHPFSLILQSSTNFPCLQGADLAARRRKLSCACLPDTGENTLNPCRARPQLLRCAAPTPRDC